MSKKPSELRFRRLNENVLKRGDIVLSTGVAFVSKAIRIATKSDISHAMLYVEDRSVIDATGEGVHARNTQRLLFEPRCAVHVMRLRQALSPEQLQAVTTYMRERIGTEYTTKEAVMTVLVGKTISSDRQFCSRLVARAFAKGGVKLVKDVNFCSPGELKDSPLLAAVENATVAVSGEEVMSWTELKDMPQLMRDATNVILVGARAIDPAIQTFDDVNRHLVAHPEDDAAFSELLASSGYLSLWRIEQDQNPWQHDLRLMRYGPRDQIEDYCWDVLNNESAGTHRFIMNRGGYESFAQQFGLRYFREMSELYEWLAMLHRQRVQVAKSWLEDEGLFMPSADIPLVPHSSEWIASLAAWDRAQADHTRHILQLAGRSDVCSICGDNPVKDYRLAEEARAAGGPNTLRLCSDCLGTRQSDDEPWYELPT
jgi:Permuted papain-like amidase enzyme, YaeF/YiiX, C92 family